MRDVERLAARLRVALALDNTGSVRLGGRELIGLSDREMSDIRGKKLSMLSTGSRRKVALVGRSMRKNVNIGRSLGL